MKKTVLSIITLLLIFMFMGCQKEVEVMTIMTPSGIPALSQMYLQQDEEQYIVDIVVGADPLVSAFAAETHDFIFAPTNLGAKLYHSSDNYRFLAGVSFGSYYFITVQEEAFTINSLENKEIVVFGQNQTSDIIVRYILSELGINATITYVDSISSASALFIQDTSKIVLMAEPNLSILKATHGDMDIIDLQDEYEQITGEDSYPQAGVFVHKNVSKQQVNQFLSDLEVSITKVNTEISASADLAVELSYSFSKEVLIEAIPRCNIGFVKAIDLQADLEAYFNVIMDLNPALIGNALPTSDFYYQP